MWRTWQQYEKAVHPGREYAVIGERLWAKHAVDRMLLRHMDQVFGRSVGPEAVEDIIAEGEVEVVMMTNGEIRWLFSSENIRVVTADLGRIVISIRWY